MQYVFINNKLTEADKAFISYQDRGFRYGDGVFETISVWRGVPYQFDWHIERLRKGLNSIKITCNLHNMHEECRKLLKENKVKEGILRIQVTRGIGSRGYLPDPKHPKAGATIVIETLPMPEVDERPVSLCLGSYRKISPQSMPVQYKLCQGLSSTLAKIEADERGCFDALLENQFGKLCETSAGNIFWVKNDILYTPALNCGVLEGSMRATVMRLSPYEVHEVDVPTEELYKADAVFITNTVWKVIPVAEVKPAKASWNNYNAAENIKKLVIKDIEEYTGNNLSRW